MTDRSEMQMPDNVQPKPDLDDITVGVADVAREDNSGETPDDPPIEDLTLPTE